VSTPCSGIGVVISFFRRYSLQTITFITSHPKKAKELSWHLNHPIEYLELDLPEIQSLDPHAIVHAKALAAYEHAKSPVLVEDFSLSLEALGGLPGPLIKWFLAELGPVGICRLLDAYSTRKATAKTCFALCIKGTVHIFDGDMEGRVATSPRGKAGYGTDGIFIPAGWEKTWAEMNKEEQNKTSLRRIGLKKLERYLADTADSL